MASKNKLKKARNSYCTNALKFGVDKFKRLYFFTSTQRKYNKKIELNEIDKEN